jgi:hypothetical protein
MSTSFPSSSYWGQNQEQKTEWLVEHHMTGRWESHYLNLSNCLTLRIFTRLWLHYYPSGTQSNAWCEWIWNHGNKEDKRSWSILFLSFWFYKRQHKLQFFSQLTNFMHYWSLYWVMYNDFSHLMESLNTCLVHCFLAMSNCFIKINYCWALVAHACIILATQGSRDKEDCDLKPAQEVWG